MAHFRFYPDVQVYMGPVRSTVFFLPLKKTVQLSEYETKILRDLNENDINTVKEKYGKAVDELVDYMVKEGYGALYDHNVYSEPYIPRCQFEVRGFLESPPVFKTVYLQLTDKCDAKCNFCTKGQYLNFQGCNSCLRWHGANTSGSLESASIEKIVSGLEGINVPAVIVSGGNPLLEWDKLLSVTRRFRELNPKINIKVHSSGSKFTEQIAEDAKKESIGFTFNIFAPDEKTTNEITGISGVFCDILQAVELSKKYGLYYDLNIVISPKVRGIYNKLYGFALSLGVNRIFTTELVPKRGDRCEILSLPVGSKRVESIGLNEFFSRKKANSCLYGCIAIASDGSILPCPGWENSIGSINDKYGIRSVFRNDLINLYWEYTKDKVPVCKSCENRFACVDCGVIDWECIKDSSYRKVICRYTPELGKWKDETEGKLLWK